MTAHHHALLVEHGPLTGAGLLRSWLEDAGWSCSVVRVDLDERLPDPVTADAVVVLGGFMSCFDDVAHPWLAPERAWVAEVVAQGVPFLGVCLGAQLLATACGGQVQRRAQGPERGTPPVRLTHAAVHDPLFSVLPQQFRAVQWHEDEITELPPGATWLASSKACPVQAFRLGANAWGVQFHPEADADTVRAWASAGGAEPVPLERDPVVARLLVERFAHLATRRWHDDGRSLSTSTSGSLSS
jgi:GMP synthase (glutamine-hydrolysing)